jgi:hypothetical protein
MASRFEYVRDIATEEIKYASSTVSQNARAIGIGLSVVVYTLVLAGDKSNFIQQHACLLGVAAVCGVLCVALDYLQYYAMIWENRSILGTLRAERQDIRVLAKTDKAKARQRAEVLLASLDNLRGRSPWAKVREFCFHAKFVAAMLGSVVIVVLIWNAVPTQAPTVP